MVPWQTVVHWLSLLAVVVLVLAAAPSQAATSFFSNATCGVPQGAFGAVYRTTSAELAVVGLGGCGARIDAEPTMEILVSLTDAAVADYAVGGALLLSVSVERSETFGVSRFHEVHRSTRAIRWTRAANATTNQQGNVTAGNVTTIAPTIDAGTNLTVQATVGQLVSFASVWNMSAHGTFRIRVTPSAQVVVLPSGEIGTVVGTTTTCDVLRPTLPRLVPFPSSGATLTPDPATNRALVAFQFEEAHYAVARDLACTVFAGGVPYSLTTNGNVSYYQAVIAADARVRVDLTAVARCIIPDGTTAAPEANTSFAANDTTTAAPNPAARLSVSSPSVDLQYSFDAVAPAPWWELSAGDEQYTVELDHAPLFFTDALYARPRFSAELGTGATLMYVVVPGDVALVEPPAAHRWKRFDASPAAPLKATGIRIDATSQLLTYAVAPGMRASAIQLRVVRMAKGTERWKYVLCGVLLCLVVAVYIGILIKQAVARQFRKRRVSQRRRADHEPHAAVPVPAGARGPDDSATVTSDATSVSSAESDIVRKHGGSARLLFGYGVWCLGDVTLFVTDLSFAVTCFSYAGVGVGYQLLYAAAMIAFALIALRRWHWANGAFDADDEQEENERQGARSGSDDDGDSGCDGCLQGRALMFTPIANLVTFPMYLRRPEPVAATVRQREFWGGVVRLCIDLPELLIVIVFIARNPTRTNDASLIKLFYALVSLIFGWRGAAKAAFLGVKEVRRCWNDDEEGSDDEGDESAKARKRKAEKRRAKERQPSETATADATPAEQPAPHQQHGEGTDAASMEPKAAGTPTDEKGDAAAASSSTAARPSASSRPATPTTTLGGVPSATGRKRDSSRPASRQPSAPSSPAKGAPPATSREPAASVDEARARHSRRPSAASDPYATVAPAAQWHPPHPTEAGTRDTASQDVEPDAAEQLQREIEAAVRLRVLRELAAAQTASAAPSEDDGRSAAVDPYGGASSPNPLQSPDRATADAAAERRPQHHRAPSMPSALTSPARAAARNPNAHVHFPTGDHDGGDAPSEAAARQPAPATTRASRPPPLSFAVPHGTDADDDAPTYDYHAAAQEQQHPQPGQEASQHAVVVADDRSLDNDAVPDYDV